MIYKLKWFEHIALWVLTSIAYLLIIKQEFAIPEYYRTGSLLLILFSVSMAFFYIVKPRHPLALSNFLSWFSSIIAATLIIVQHVVLNGGFSYSANIFIISTFSMPFAAGIVYKRFVKRRHSKQSG